MSEAKLAKIIQDDPSLVRRSSDIEVDEVTLTKKGALGDQADAVMLLKQTEEASPDELVADEVATEEVAEVAVLEKEEPTGEVVLPEIDFESAVAFIRKGELTDDQKTSLVDMALELNQAVDLEKSGDDVEMATIEPVSESAFPAEAMEMLKSISEAVSGSTPSISLNAEQVHQLWANLAAQHRIEELPVELIKSDETNTEDIVVPSLADSVGMRLLKAQEERLAQGRAEQDASLLNAVSSLSASLSAVTQKLEASGQKLSRACGQDA
jgi:hypothetical protein